MAIINGVKVGYTDNGNAYLKSDSGKKAGAAVAATGTVAGGAYLLSKFAKNNMVDLYKHPPTPGYKTACNSGKLKDVVNFIKQFIKKPEGMIPEHWFRKEFAKNIRNIKYTKLVEKLYKHPKFVRKVEPILRTKVGRAGLVASAVALPIGAAILIGRGIGALCDKCHERSAKKQADFDARFV